MTPRQATAIATGFIAVLLAALGCSSESSSSADGRTRADRRTKVESRGEHAPPQPAGRPTANDGSPTPDAPDHDVAARGSQRRASPDHDADAPADARPGAAPATGAKTASAEPTGELRMPLVALTERHAADCRVKVGDSLPTATAKDLDGKEHSLSTFYGTSYTVVVFVNLDDPLAAEELDDLGPLVAATYAAKGVKVVAVCVDGDADAARQSAAKWGLKYPLLVDPQAAALSLVAASASPLMPRTYLIDKSGKIVWFDVEYSRTTRRDLHQALRFLLKSSERPAGA